MERLTYRDEHGRARLTNYGARMYCSTQATADCFCELEEALAQKTVARVMTLEEVKALPDEADVWLEEFPCVVVAATVANNPVWREMEKMGYVEPRGNRMAFYGVTTDWNGEDFYNFEDYNKIDAEVPWRIWTSRPTKEQINEVAWDE